MADNSIDIQQSHPAVFRRELRSGEVQPVEHTLTIRAHHPTELASATISTTSKPVASWSISQLNALSALRRAMSMWTDECEKEALAFPGKAPLIPQSQLPPRRVDSVSGATLPNCGVPSAEFINTLIEPISELFFMGQLGSVPFSWDETLKVRQSAVGLCSTYRTTRQSWITIDPKWCSYEFDGRERVEDTFGTLLHECAHAWLFKYGCTVPEGFCPKAACRAHHIEHTGLTGHGSAWVKLSRHIQVIAQEHIGVHIDLHVQRSIDFERRTRLRV